MSIQPEPQLRFDLHQAQLGISLAYVLALPDGPFVPRRRGCVGSARSPSVDWLRPLAHCSPHCNAHDRGSDGGRRRTLSRTIRT